MYVYIYRRCCLYNFSKISSIDLISRVACSLLRNSTCWAHIPSQFVENFAKILSRH